MNRNQESRFNKAPMTGIERSKVPYKQEHLSTIKMGELVPFFSDETIMPSDTFQINFDAVIRMLTAKHPFMTTLYLDVYFFFVPMRLVWEHTEEYFGENPNGAWVQITEYYTPIVKCGTGGFKVGSVIDYLYGARLDTAGLEVSALSLRSYVKCYNDWFRDQNWIAPKTERMGDADTTYDDTDTTTGGRPFKIAKYHDPITSLLPAPQKGTAVSIPLGTSAPVSVFGNGKTLGLTNGSNNVGLTGYSNYNGNKDIFAPGAFNIAPNTTGVGGGVTGAFGVVTDPATSGLTGTADLSAATAANINAMREAFAYQRILEKLARGGSRYQEIIRSFFGVTADSARLQRAEYLGGKSIPIEMTEVPQTAETIVNVSPQANLAAYSRTVTSNRIFTKSFTEYGILIGMYAIRQTHYYQQGIEKQYKIRRKFERYWPQLAHIGEQPIYREEIFATGNATSDKTVLGFNEAWWFYRYRLNKITGYMRSGITGSLDIWHTGDYYTNAPVISEQFINETDTYLRRCLAVTDNETHQFLIVSNVYGYATRPMPLFCIPGLIDHY